MRLAEALGVRAGDVVALVGAGGKTAALYRLAEELGAGHSLVATTTTHMLPPPAPWPLILAPHPADGREAALRAIAACGRAFVASSRLSDGRLVGIPPGEVPSLAALAEVTLVEADGARGRWVKAPAAHEPAMPAAASLVVPVVGLQALGRSIDSPCVHRPEHLAHLLGVSPSESLTPALLARLLQHERGGLCAAPASARIVPLLNQADGAAERCAGREIAAAVLGRCNRVRRVAIAALQYSEACECWQPTAAIVLAAGASRRFGRLKQAEPWRGSTLLQRAVAAALSSLASHVVVVLGCEAERLRASLPPEGGRLRVIINSSWAEGRASSVRAGLGAIRDCVQAVVFLNADQPLLTGREVDALLVRYAETGVPLVGPRCAGVLRSPVLFARPLFAELQALTGEQGGRIICVRHAGEAAVIDMADHLPFTDIDTPADLTRLDSTVGEDMT